MTSFIRSARVIVRIRRDDFQGYEKTLTLTNLRVSFSIQKNLAIQTNPGVIRIWNLSQDHRNLIKDFGDEVTIYAGYERGAGEQLLYRGDTTAVSHTFDLPDIVTTLECGDGERYVNQKHFSLSFEAGTKVEDVIRSIAGKMGINIAELSSTNNMVYELGFSFAGMLKEALSKATDYAGLQWSVQNNGLQIIPKTGTITQPSFKINSETGMVGIPQRFTYKRQDFYILGPAVGWKVTTLLNPLIIPGYKVDVSSRYLGWQGIFRVETVRHDGDTYGDAWQTNLELTQLPG
jgi:hypothetical protein